MPLAGPAGAGPLGGVSRKTCVVCHADLDAPPDPGSALVEGMLGVLGGITGSPLTGEKGRGEKGSGEKGPKKR